MSENINQSLNLQQKNWGNEKLALYEVLPSLEDIFLVINQRFENMEQKMKRVEKTQNQFLESLEKIQDIQKSQSELGFYSNKQKKQNNKDEYFLDLNNYQGKQSQEIDQIYQQIQDLQKKQLQNEESIIYNHKELQSQIEDIQLQDQDKSGFKNIQNQIKTMEKTFKEQTQTNMEEQVNKLEFKFQNAVILKKEFTEEIQNGIESLKNTLCQVIDLVIQKGINDDIEKDQVLTLKEKEILEEKEKKRIRKLKKLQNKQKKIQEDSKTNIENYKSQTLSQQSQFQSVRNSNDQHSNFGQQSYLNFNNTLQHNYFDNYNSNNTNQNDTITQDDKKQQLCQKKSSQPSLQSLRSSKFLEKNIPFDKKQKQINTKQEKSDKTVQINKKQNKSIKNKKQIKNLNENSDDGQENEKFNQEKEKFQQLIEKDQFYYLLYEEQQKLKEENKKFKKLLDQNIMHTIYPPQNLENYQIQQKQQQNQYKTDN
ncbi:hypothetical protein PPERSA_04780 [Pseudocohnilembus persalinus]|uniref:Uncharacterized protein n=1 Tax=Pseudocohnilembus persalinus TaxID=266149 RepID=A0A0V0Q9L3_PSEPJ|nr:hypothetical protein PPERSA_04780 [Pseudocohnilembus persalinus]|eukprot:KRW98847.1 hypothetical protein PPERSA_04780 [Pseudocohnilembus persalinus]